jgi:protein-tyrosine phosphatase
VSANNLSSLPVFPLRSDGFCLDRFDFRGNRLTHQDVADLIKFGKIDLGDFPETVPQHVIDGIYVGSALSARNAVVLRKLNVSVFINAARGKDGRYVDQNNVSASNYQPEFLTLNMRDDDTQTLRPAIDTACACLEKAVAAGKKTIVYCQMGVSRSVTVISAYLIKNHQMSPLEAIEFIRQQRCQADPIPHFVAQLEDFAAEVRLEQKA